MPKTEEQCDRIRKETKEKIINNSILYFARNGFSATRISDLAEYIGIGQGTLYQYFTSKEELYHEIMTLIDNKKDIKEIKLLATLPLSAKAKIRKLSETIIDNLNSDQYYSAKVTLQTQVMFKDNTASQASTYQSEVYKYTQKIIEQGQREKSFVDGDATKLTDYYWSVVYLYALKKQFTKEFFMIDAKDLNRLVLKEGE